MSDEIEVRVRRMLQEFEHKIVEINKRNIRDIVGEISEADFVLLAEAISVCRAHYLREALKIASTREGKLSINVSKKTVLARKRYEEAMQGFEALKQALGRGYFVIKEE